MVPDLGEAWNDAVAPDLEGCDVVDHDVVLGVVEGILVRSSNDKQELATSRDLDALNPDDFAVERHVQEDALLVKLSLCC